VTAQLGTVDNNNIDILFILYLSKEQEGF
jgi:hypothetical protein